MPSLSSKGIAIDLGEWLISVLCLTQDSYMFSTSSKGIVKQALTGAGKEFQRVARELIKYPVSGQE